MRGYRGGVVAMAGVLVAAAATGDFESGTGTLGVLFRLAIICIFFRRAVRRDRMLWTTTVLY